MYDADFDIAALAEALAHPAGLRIFRLLPATPGSISGDIVETVGLALSSVPEHLRIRKAAGAITGEISVPPTCDALDPAALEPLADFVGVLTPPSNAACWSPAEKEVR